VPISLAMDSTLTKGMQETTIRYGKKKPSDKKAIKRSQFKERKKAYIHAKAAYEACMSTSTDSDEETSNSDDDEDSNMSVSSYSSEDSNIS
jgi:hypothetical protein